MSNHNSSPSDSTVAPVEDDDTLGPCGCVDYHMADCGIMTATHDWWAEAERGLDNYFDDYDY